MDLNHVEFKCYHFLISLDKCSGSCNILSPKIYLPKETKDINVKTFNMITKKNEAKTITKHISCDCKCKLISTTCSSNQKWNNETCQCKCKNHCTCKKDYNWNPRTCTCENSKCSKSIADTLAIECDELMSVINIVLTKMANTIAQM